MSELKAFDITVAEEGYYEGIVKYRRAVYDKSEADKVIAHNKYKRCLAMAQWCFEKSYSTTLVKYDKESGLLRNFYDWWGKRWLELADKFKEAK